MDNYLVQHYLENSAAHFPKAIAVVDGVRSISYQQLDRLANRVARRLVALGFRQGEPAGVYFPKSIEALIAFNAILKAGGVYIPLDAQYSPIERIRRICMLSATRWVITSETGWSSLNGTFPGIQEGYGPVEYVVLFDATPVSLGDKDERERGNTVDGCHRIPLAIDTGSDKETEVYPPDLTHNATEDDLAYVLYTSGSTGDPKGVMITHRNAITFVNWATAEFSPRPHAVFANHAPFHFDLSVFDIYGAFATGGSVHLVPATVMNNPRALLEWIDQHRIEYWYSVPSVWIAILNYATIESCKMESLKVILFAGEVFPPKFLKGLMNALPGRRYYNLYGPTETNVCTSHEVGSIDEIGEEPVPIGRACTNTDVMALNGELQEVAVGETGELYVRGPCVAKGYYRNPEKTAESFRTIPSLPHGEQQVYATGDIVQRTTPDTYRYVGRKDLMVKCAGFRVELQEIETALDMHQSIMESVVVPWYREERGSVSLVAYVTFKHGMQARISELKKFCITKLPHYMVPEQIYILDELPRNANGKIDRQAVLRTCGESLQNKGED